MGEDLSIQKSVRFRLQWLATPQHRQLFCRDDKAFELLLTSEKSQLLERTYTLQLLQIALKVSFIMPTAQHSHA